MKAFSGTISEARRIVSFTEAEAFLRGLSYAATTPVLLLLWLVLWAVTCCLSLQLLAEGAIHSFILLYTLVLPLVPSILHSSDGTIRLHGVDRR